MPALMITKIIDNTEEVLREKKEQALVAFQSIGQEVERAAKEDCPVDSGRLRNSIKYKVVRSEVAVYIGTNVEYAPYVEFIDRYAHPVGKAHFLRDAVQDHMEYYKSILEAALK